MSFMTYCILLFSVAGILPSGYDAAPLMNDTVSNLTHKLDQLEEKVTLKLMVRFTLSLFVGEESGRLNE